MSLLPLLRLISHYKRTLRRSRSITSRSPPPTVGTTSLGANSRIRSPTMYLQSIFFLVLGFFSYLTEANFASEEHKRSKRLAVHPSRWNTNLWPDGIVPYDIASHYTASERAIILSGMAEFHKHSCIRFHPRRASDKYYLQINKHYNLERCFSYIGRQVVSMFRTPQGNVETRMKLDPTCLMYNGRGTVMHELMHILGFYHEHQRDDRDRRISGVSGHYNYKIYPRASTYYMGAYDINSIMHYNFNGITVQSRSYFSSSDIWRLNTLYKCQSRGPKESTYYFEADYARYSQADETETFTGNDLRKKI